MSKTNIPNKTLFLLWGKSAGRCEFTGCNKMLSKDDLTQKEYNNGQCAHIIADSPNGPRGNSETSMQISKDLSNLILLCPEHHKLIDDDPKTYTVDKLLQMKEEHEKNIEYLTSFNGKNVQSYIIIYGANIGKHNCPIVFNKVTEALLKDDLYPAERTPIELSIGNSFTTDNMDSFWNLEVNNLCSGFETRVAPRIINKEIKHCSVFALAPIPLLIKLATLLTDQIEVNVYQKHREPDTWQWIEAEEFEYSVIRPQRKCKTVALNLSLSATIPEDDIKLVLGDDVAIWKITIEAPNNDYLKSKNHLKAFRETYRKIMDDIKRTHGNNIKIHLFPAIPNSVAVELGRVYMPKADLPIVIYDRNQSDQGKIFKKAIEIGDNDEIIK